VVHDHLCAQQDLQKHLAESFTLGPQETSGNGKQLLHALLARFTEEIAQSIDAQHAEITQLRQQLRVAQAMLDRSYYGFLLHTAPVPEAQRPQRKADTERRYQRWIDEVRSLTALRGHHGPADPPAAASDPSPGKAPA